MEQILAYRELFKELGICNLCNIGIAIVLFVPYRVVIHCLLQGRSDAYIVDDKTAFLITEDSVNAGDGLHQVVTLHWFIDIHCCKGWYIKARQPHIYDNGNFQGTVIILEFLCQFVFVVLVSNDFTPFFRVFVALGHYNGDFFRPRWAQFENAVVYLHSNGTRICNNHRLTCEQVRTVIFVVVKNVAD